VLVVAALRSYDRLDGHRLVTRDPSTRAYARRVTVCIRADGALNIVNLENCLRRGAPPLHVRRLSTHTRRQNFPSGADGVRKTQPPRILSTAKPDGFDCRELESPRKITTYWRITDGVSTATITGGVALRGEAPKTIVVVQTLHRRAVRGTTKVYVLCAGSTQVLTLSASGPGDSSYATAAVHEARAPPADRRARVQAHLTMTGCSKQHSRSCRRKARRAGSGSSSRARSADRR
jgi:hypothetical protein